MDENKPSCISVVRVSSYLLNSPQCEMHSEYGTIVIVSTRKLQSVFQWCILRTWMSHGLVKSIATKFHRFLLCCIVLNSFVSYCFLYGIVSIEVFFKDKS